MASGFGSFGLNDPDLDSLVADLYADQHLLHLFNMYLFGSGGAYIPQGVFEQPNHPSISSSDLHLDFSQGAPWHATRQNTLPPLSDIPGPSSFQFPAFATPLDADFEGEIGAGLWGISDTDPPIVAPTLAPTLSLPMAAAFPLNWTKVPQRDYNQGRKQWSFKPLEPISFSVGGRPGVNMRDALRKKFENLDGRDDPVLQDTLGAISCWFLFPGYPANGSSCQIHALDWTKKRRPITRSKLVHEVARKLERYLHDMAKLPLDASIENRWKIGQGIMKIENLFLVRLVSVSKGSFQPEIWVSDPSMPHAFLG